MSTHSDLLQEFERHCSVDFLPDSHSELLRQHHDLERRFDGVLEKLRGFTRDVAEIQKSVSAMDVISGKAHHDVHCLKYEMVKLNSLVQSVSSDVALFKDTFAQDLNNVTRDLDSIRASSSIQDPIVSPPIGTSSLHRMPSLSPSGSQVARGSGVLRVDEAILDDLRYDIRCLKSEVRKLKCWRPEISAEVVQAGEKSDLAQKEVADLRSELAEMSGTVALFRASPTVAQAIESGLSDICPPDVMGVSVSPSVVHDIRCLKHEVRRLKSIAGGDGYSDIEVIGYDRGIVELRNELSSIKRIIDSSNRLARKAQEQSQSLQAALFGIQAPSEDELGFDKGHSILGDLRHDMRCLKHEMHRLKCADDRSPSSNESSLDHQSRAEIQRLREELTVMQQRLSSSTFRTVDDSRMKTSVANLVHDMRCVKHELRRLKVLFNPSSDPDSPNELQFSSTSLPFGQIFPGALHDIRCLKHEVRRLKAISRGESSDVMNLVGTSDLHELRNELDHVRKQVASLRRASLASDVVCTEDDTFSDGVIRDLRCLKHEVRKLKALSTTPTFELAKVAEQVDQSRQEVDRLRIAFEGLKRAKPTQSSFGEGKYHDMTHAIRCLKHEVRKLKTLYSEGQEMATLQEKVQALMNIVGLRTSEVPSSVSDSGGVMDSLLGTLQHDVRCLKHEVQKLKRPSPSGTSGRSAVVRLADEARTEVERLRADFDKMRQEHDFGDRPREASDSDDLSHDVRCLKHEVRRLKLRTGDLDILHRAFERLESSFLDIRCAFGAGEQRLLSRIEAEIVSLRAMGGLISPSSLEHDVRCLKHEVRLLKSRSSGSIPLTSPGIVPGPDAGLIVQMTEARGRSAFSQAEFGRAEPMIRRLDEKVDALASVISGISLDQLRRDVKCVKFELKRLFAVKPDDRSGRSPGIEHLISVLTADVRADLRDELRDVRQLLRRVSREPVRPLSQDASGPVNSDLEDLRRDIEELRRQTGRGPGSVAQVFVDLPEAASVQLVFRAEHASGQ